MAKHTRKPTAAQRDKAAIAVAKALKAKGILSKSVKLHGGKYISQRVLKKVNELQAYQRGYKVVPVSKAYAKAAIAEGYTVVAGNKVVVPSRHDFIKRVKDGLISGVHPVRGGTMEAVHLPIDPKNMGELMRMLEERESEFNQLKLTDEKFAFKVWDNGIGGMSHRAFPSMWEMAKRFQFYNPDLDVGAVTFFRLNRHDEVDLLMDPKKREQTNRANRIARRSSQDRRARGKKESWIAKIEALYPERADRIRDREMARQAKRRAEIAADPKAHAAYKKAAALRERERYARIKEAKERLKNG